LAEAIDETSAAVRSKTGGTGPHWHFAIASGGGASDIRPPEPGFAGPGFQGADQAFRVASKAPIADGVSASIYDIAGNSSKIESRMASIGERVDRERLSAVKEFETTRKLKGYEASDLIWSKYGTRVLTGDYDPQDVIKELSQAGYSGPVISQALGNLKEAQGESAGLASARNSWLGNDPQTGKYAMDLATEGRRNGYSPEYEAQVEAAVLAGDIDGPTGARLVDSAIDKTDRDNNRAEAEERRDEKKSTSGAGQKVKSATQINEGAKGFVLDITSQTAQVNKLRKAKGLPPVVWSEASIKTVEARFKAAALRHLATNPGDYSGAYEVMQAEVEKATNNLLGRT
jgi:hypothetical protein